VIEEAKIIYWEKEGFRWTFFGCCLNYYGGGDLGSSTMVVATLHAIYRLIKDYDKDEKYNGK